MWLDKLMENTYGLFVNMREAGKWLNARSSKRLYEIQYGAVIHIVAHQIADKDPINTVVKHLVDNGCTIFHLFGGASDIWVDSLKTIGGDRVIVIEYDFQLQDFIADIATHLVEDAELSLRNMKRQLDDRMDYVLYDDYGFFWMIQEDIDEYREGKNVE